LALLPCRWRITARLTGGRSPNDILTGSVLQLTYIPSISRLGSWRAVIEGVRVDSSRRSSGIGRKLFAWAIERARSRGCMLLQLTSDKSRIDAIRFYESLGFVASHEGMKLQLGAAAAQR
jgi:GNAT superfamily N-acetyltransferase